MPSDIKIYPINGYAPGHYDNVCINCERVFEGDKRASRCPNCATLMLLDENRALTARLSVAVEALRGLNDELDIMWNTPADLRYVDGKLSEIIVQNIVNAQIAAAQALSTLSDGAVTTETCETCAGNGEVVTDWDRYMNGPLDENGEDAVKRCDDCEGTGTIPPTHEPALPAPAGDGWRPVSEAPHACHVLATYWDAEVGEWIVNVVMSPPVGLWTHFRPLPPAPTGGE